MPAIVRAQNIDQLARGGPFHVQRAAEIDLAVQRLADEAMPVELEIFRQFALRKIQRVEIGSEMPAHAIGADEQHGADGIARCALHSRIVHDLSGLRRGGLHRKLHGRRIKRRRQIVRAIQRRPVRPIP